MQQMFSCPRCGSQNVVGSNLCRSCGVGLIAVCPHCRTNVSLLSKFCTSCGVELIEVLPPQRLPIPQMVNSTANTNHLNKDEIVIGLIRYAAERAAEGKNRSQVADELTRQGVPYDIAAQVVKKVFGYRSQLEGKEGGKQMGCGLLMLIVGGIITIGTYLAASGGGTYIVAYGLIFVGVINLIIGFVRWLKS